MRRSLYGGLLLAWMAFPAGVQAVVAGSVEAQRLSMLDAMTRPRDAPPAVLSVTPAPLEKAQVVSRQGMPTQGVRQRATSGRVVKTSSRQQQRELKALQTRLQQVKKENGRQAEKLARLRGVHAKNSALAAEVVQLKQALKRSRQQDKHCPTSLVQRRIK
ncbi:hypothetical protein [Serratia fonticola]|uniref:hypothetical protein n=1 Tax=Serratia fonticola TaxID=47917 RepID=UPI00093BC52D|nr:hypothetical protein [Serratia fonticola]OKP23823.1 hypothetical protein BSQ40_24305 [Serratia fonticola]